MNNLIFKNKKYSFHIYSIYTIIIWKTYHDYQNKNIINNRSKFIKSLKKKNIYAIIYAFSNFSISLFGYIQIVNHVSLDDFFPNFNWKADGYFMIIVGIISFFSDVVFFGINNMSKPADYLLSGITVLHNIFKVILAYKKNHRKNTGILISFFAGFIPLYFSNYYYLIGNLNKYYLFHSIWHYFPLIVYIIYLKVNLDSKIKLFP